MITLRFDGLFKEVPGAPDGYKAGFMGYGWLILKRGVVIAHGHGVFAHGQVATSNTAEYLALIEGLEALLDMGMQAEKIEIIGDAKSVIEQMRGVSAVSSPQTKVLHRRADQLAQRFGRVYWSWTPRKNNRDADQLTRRAMRQITRDPKDYEAALSLIQPWNKNHHYGYLPLADLRVYQPR